MCFSAERASFWKSGVPIGIRIPIKSLLFASLQVCFKKNKESVWIGIKKIHHVSEAFLGLGGFCTVLDALTQLSVGESF